MGIPFFHYTMCIKFLLRIEFFSYIFLLNASTYEFKKDPFFRKFRKIENSEFMHYQEFQWAFISDYYSRTCAYNIFHVALMNTIIKDGLSLTVNIETTL